MNRGNTDRSSSQILMLKLPILQLGLLFLSLFSFPYSNFAQDYTINLQAFGLEDGLLHRSTTTIFEDKDGIIWIGSNKGLQRFDGHDFKSWTTKTAPFGKFTNITTIGQDQEGWLWLWNNHILEFVFLHPQTEEILSQEERFGLDFPIKRFPEDNTIGWSGTAGYLKTDSKGRLYFASSTPSELIVYDAKKGFLKYPLPDLKSNFIELYFLDSHDVLWITESFTNSMLYKVDTIGNIISKSDYSYSYDISDIKEIGETFYFTITTSTKVSIYKIDQSGNHILLKEKPRKANTPTYINDFTWDYHEDNLLVYPKEDIANPVFSFEREGLPKQFSDNTAAVFKDSKGRYWFPSDWGLGLAVIKPNLFKKYFSFEDNSPKPINNSARGVLIEDDTLYANFEFGGLVRIPLQTPDQWNIIYKPKKNGSYLGRPLSKAASGGLYIGYPDKNVSHFNLESNSKNDITFLEYKTLGRRACWSFYTAPDQRLWIGMDEGIAYKNPNEDHLQFIPASNTLMKTDLINHICPDKDGKLWFSGIKGLYHFDPETKSFIDKYGNLEADNFRLAVGYFHYLYIDADDIFWLGTNEGLLRWNRKTNEQRLFTTIDGLSNDVIYAVFEDDNNHLWMSSDYGIMQFNKETYHVNAFLEKDGIAQQEFNRISAFQEKNGTIYFGGLNGITAFHPKDFPELDQQTSAPMLISAYEIFDGESAKLLNKTGELRTTNTIDFHPKDRFFRLGFSLPNFENAQKVNYAWQIEGLDKDWNYQKENTIQIGKLPYGNHVLRIKGQQDNGKWSPNELAIQVNVLKPFYLQTWFILLSFLILSALLYSLYKIRTLSLKRRQKVLESEIEKATSKILEDKNLIEEQTEELRQLDKVKSNFFANVSHELRTPLTLILGPISSVLKNNKLENQDFTHLTKAQQNGKELLKLVASILSLSKMESGKLELIEKPVALFSFLQKIVSTFAAHAQREDIRFEFVYHPEKSLHLALDKGKLETILNNLLSNAFKFSQAGGKIIFTIDDLGNTIKFSLQDHGRGIHEKDLPFIFDRFYQSKQPDAPTEGGTGIGLALSQEMTKIMAGKIWVESEFGKGSTFHLTIPRKEILGTLSNPASQTEDASEINENPVLTAKAESNSKINDPRPVVLIVEDNYALRGYLKTVLESLYQVWTAENGIVALDLLNENQQSLPSLIVSDIMMPAMDGFQLLKVLKSKTYFQHIPVIMLTARADIQDKIKALRIGVDDYLLKPFEEEELLARVENILLNYQERINSQQIYLEEEVKEDTSELLPVISIEDTEWLEELEEHLSKHLSNNNFSITQLAFDLAISERQLRRRIKTLTGLSPTQYLKETRLQAARQLLEQRRFNTVAQTAGAVGFQDARAFSRNFSNRFGKTPSEYLQD